MKASAEKSSSAVSRTTASRPFFAKAGGGDFFAPVNRAAVPAVQAKMTVGKTGDKFEREADNMADKVMRMPTPASSAKEEKIQKKTDERLQKAAKPEDKIQKKEKQEEKIQKAPAGDDKLRRKGEGTPIVAPNVQSAIRSKASGGGQPLSADVRRDMEGRFNADFSQVRVHSDAEAGKLSNQLSARAFTHRNHIFFSRNQYQPGTSEGKQLLAHELTHTIQQGHAVQRSPQVSTTVTPPTVQRLLGIDIPSWQDVLNWLADKAYNIPGYRMFTIVIGSNPINGASADRSAANILRAIVEFLPGGKVITDALQKYSVFEKAGSWIEGKLKRFENLLETVKLAVSKFMKDLDFIDVILHPVRTWEKAVNIFKNPVDQIISFIGGIFQDIFQFIRDAVLMPLAALAQGKPGFDLLCAILGKNPITKEVVPRTPDTLIGGFMKLIGQEEVWENIKKGNAIQKAWKWFNDSLQELLSIVTQFPDDFIAMLKSLEVMDFIVLPSLFIKVFKVFGNFVVKFTSWGLNTVLSLLEILVSVVRPTVMPYIKKAQASFVTIIKNPVGFVGNLVRAGKLGFEMFAGNILTHLKTALIKWLVGPLAEAGVYIPQSFQLMEIIKLVLSVLGLTWQNIRAKLVKIIPDPVLSGLEKTASILVTLVKDGPAAAWEQIKAELTELKDQLIGQVTEMISTEVVKAAVTKLVSMLNPAGAVIQAIIAIYNTVTFFIEKAQQIGAVVASFIDSIAAIAAGQVAPAAKRVEQTLANTLVVVIGFLAKFAGLGNIPTKLVGIVKKVRKPIDKGLDKIVGWLGKVLKNMASRVLGGDPNAPAAERVANGLREAVPVVNRYAGRRIGAAVLRPLLLPIKLRHRLSLLDVVPHGDVWAVKARGSGGKQEETKAKIEERDVKGRGIEGLTTRIKYQPGTVAGHKVGKKMTANPLGPDHPMGQRPLGENIWKDLLVTDPNKTDDKKYVRGHLLNHKIGGSGAADNLFPITASANQIHESEVEKHVKKLVNTDRLWVFYEVEITDIKEEIHNVNKDKNREDKSGKQIELNKIDSNIKCTFSTIKLPDNCDNQDIQNIAMEEQSRKNTTTATVASKYQQQAIVGNKTKEESIEDVKGSIKARKADSDAVVELPRDNKKINDESFKNINDVLKVVLKTEGSLVKNIKGIGEASFSLLKEHSNGINVSIYESLPKNKKSNLMRINNNNEIVNNIKKLLMNKE